MAIKFMGLDLMNPVNRIPEGRASITQNIRSYFSGGVSFRNLLTNAILTVAAAVHSIRRINDSTPNGPPSGFALVIGAGNQMYLNSTPVAGGFSGNPVSIVPFRPNQSVQPWAYVADSAPEGNVVIYTNESTTPTITPTSTTWTSPANATSNTLFASTTLSGNANSLLATVGPLSLPAGSTVLGVTVSANAYFSVADGQIAIQCFSGQAGGSVDTAAVTTTPSIIGAGGTGDLWSIPAALFQAGFSFQIYSNSSASGTLFLNQLTITVTYVGTSGFVSNGQIKIRTDGLTFRTGIKEPQLAPVVSTQNSSINFGGVGSMLATAIPWTNFDSANSDFDYGETEGFPNTGPTPPVDGTPPFVINCLNATSITITALANDGTVVITGVTDPVLTAQSAGRVTPGAPGWPGQFIQIGGTGSTPTTASYVVGAFMDASGNVIPAGVAPLFVPNIVDVGLAFSTATPIPVPFGAVTFQVGINSEGNTFSANSGVITLEGTVTTDALPSKTSILGTLQLWYWGDSPNSGPVASYIWKNPDDPGGSGPTRSTSNANGSTSNNSFIFDASFGSGATPPQPAGIPGLPGTGNDTEPMQWTTLTPESVASGSVAVFAAPLITTYPNNTNYDNFNFCMTGNIYFPAAGLYTFNLTNHDDCIWGIGGGVTLSSATSTFNGGATTPALSLFGQTITVVGGYPLLPRGPYNSGEGGDYATATVIVNVPAAGIYPIEIDYDYWFHSGRILLLDASPTPGAPATIIPPLPSNVRQGVQYRYVYRSTATGATSNPSPESAAETVPVSANTITSLWSNDPQVDVVDYYRLDDNVANFPYVATGPNDNLGSVPGTNTPISDSLTDTELGNQLLSFDNFEPFPSIDLPQKGTCSVSGGTITWLSGGAIGGTQTGFNLRWLAGTTILIGSPTSLAYVFIARPTSTTTVTIPGVPDATNVAYQIAQPILANQPLAFLFGPSDNVNYTFAVGDPLRPGTLYWCAGSDLDSAPDSNQEDVTDPSEPLMNGIMTGGRGIVFSISRSWFIIPNFYNAVATATGVEGSTWSLQATSISRGLFMPRCLAVEGSGLIFFRVNDGIHVSPGGAASKSITDTDLYPIFPHENEDGGTSLPQPVTREGVTIYPPDDTLPQLQRFRCIGEYMYWDYQGTEGVFHTLVFDINAGGWVWDLYTPTATCHAANDGVSTQGTLVGCSDGTIRMMASEGTESGTAIIMSPAFGGKGWQHARQVIVEYSSTATITLTLFPADSGNGSYGPPPIILPSTGGALDKLKVDAGPGPNKWRLAWFMFSSTEPFTVNLDGFVCYVKDWGSSGPYKPMQPFAGEGGGG